MIDLYELAGADPDHRFSPYCWRIRMALAHKGLEANLIPWRFTEKADLPGAPANARVPVMVDEGRVFADSSRIAHHLEADYPNSPPLFGGPGGEAHARFIVAWADLTLQPAIFQIVAPDVVGHLAPKDQAYFRLSREAFLGRTLEAQRDHRDALVPAFRATLAPLRHTLKAQPFVGGTEPTYADYAVFGAFQWARCVSPAALLEEGDSLRDWLETMLDLFDGHARQAVIPASAAATE